MRSPRTPKLYKTCPALSGNIHCRRSLSTQPPPTPSPSGAAIRFDGQVTVFDPRIPESPCYACIFPESDLPEETRCANMGVFAPLVGIVGATQAAEALKLLCGIGQALTGRLLMLDGRGMEWHQMTLVRNKSCPVCGTITDSKI